MAVQTENIQLNVLVNGTAAKSTIKDLEQEYKKLNAQIKNLEVGSDAFNAKTKELQEVGSRLREVREQVRGVDAQTQSLGDRFTKLDGGGGVFSRLKQQFSETKESIGGATNGLSGFQLGMFGVIGAVVALLGYSLYSYFTKTDEGATKLEGVMGALRAVVDRLLGGFVAVGEYVATMWDKPGQVFKDFIKLLTDQVTVRLNAIVRSFKALGDVLSGDVDAGMKAFFKAQVDLATGVENTVDKVKSFTNEVIAAGNAAYDMALAMDALSDAERDYSIIQQQNKNRIEELLLLSRNRSKTDEQRLAYLKEAAALEKKDFLQRLDFAKQNLALVQKQNAIDKAAGKDTDEMAQKEVDAKLAILKLEEESIQLREKIAKWEAALRETMAKDKASFDAERIKKAKEVADIEAKYRADIVAFERKMEDLSIQNLADTYEQKRQQAMKAYERELEDFKGSAELKAQLEIELTQKLSQELNAINQKQREDATKQAIDQIGLSTSMEEAALKLKYSTQTGSQQQFETDLYNLKLQALEQQRTLLITAHGAESDEVKRKEIEITNLKADYQTKQTQNEAAEIAKRKQMRAQELQSARNLASGLMDLMVDVLGESAKNTKAYKAIASADVILNGIQEVQRIWKGYAEFGPVGYALAIAQTGVAAARTSLAVQKINSISVSSGAKMARKGTILQGSKHGAHYGDAGLAIIDRLTGIEVAEAEGGEPILTANIRNNPTVMRQISRYNVEAGGNPLYAAGGVLGVDAPDMQNQDASNPDSFMFMLLNEQRKTNLLLANQRTTLAAEVSLTEFTKKQTLEEKINAKANA